jgi:hypothetical protein
MEITELYLKLTERVSASGEFLLSRFEVESEVHHAYEVRDTRRPGEGWRTEVFKPDAYGELSDTVTGAAWHIFAEVDMGNVCSEEWARRLAIARRYLSSPELFARRYAADPGRARLIVLTTTERRLQHLLAIARQEEARFCRFITFAAFHEAPCPAPGIRADIWQASYSPGPVALFDEGEP